MALGHRLFLIIVILLVLQYRPVLAPPWRAEGSAEDSSDDTSASWLDAGLEPLGNPADSLLLNGFPLDDLEPERNPTVMPIGEGDPGSWLHFSADLKADDMEVPVVRSSPSQLDSRLPPSQHHRGPPTEKYQAKRGRKKALEIDVKNMLEDLESLKDVVGESTTTSVDIIQRADSAERLPDTTRAASTQGSTSVLCPQDVLKICMISTATTVVLLPLGILLCYRSIRWKINKKCNKKGAAAARKQNSIGDPSHMGRAQNSRKSRNSELKKNLERWKKCCNLLSGESGLWNQT